MKIRLLCDIPCDELKKGEVYDTIDHYEKHAVIRSKAGRICYIPVTRYEPVDVNKTYDLLPDGD